MKILIRQRFLSKRKKLSPERRKEGQQQLIAVLTPLINSSKGLVLSFASMRNEIEMRDINTLLARDGKLVLPKIIGNALHFYLVPDLTGTLDTNVWGIEEPHPDKCQEVDINDITLAFIPGVAFDAENHRLGYGGGFYDRCLHTLTHAMTYGVGFAEQLSPTPLPKQAHDVPVNKLILV